MPNGMHGDVGHAAFCLHGCRQGARAGRGSFAQPTSFESSRLGLSIPNIKKGGHLAAPCGNGLPFFCYSMLTLIKPVVICAVTSSNGPLAARYRTSAPPLRRALRSSAKLAKVVCSWCVPAWLIQYRPLPPARGTMLGDAVSVVRSIATRPRET